MPRQFSGASVPSVSVVSSSAGATVPASALALGFLRGAPPSFRAPFEAGRAGTAASGFAESAAAELDGGALDAGSGTGSGGRAALTVDGATAAVGARSARE